LPEDTFVVLGCGTLDLRKGIDHFAGVARTLLGRRKMERPVHFVWLGEGDRWIHSPYHYMMLDVAKTCASHHVHFIGEREDVEPWFMGSDAFLLTSRVDPFPCVVHEAMAARLPVITFDQSGGAPSAVRDGAGLIVPFGDYEAASHMIEWIAAQPAFAEAICSVAHERVHTRYRFDHYAHRLIRLAEELMHCRLTDRHLECEPGAPAGTLGHPTHRAA
jgi:glycosyltransferase involved in cell wall biosynthesis